MDNSIVKKTWFRELFDSYEDAGITKLKTYVYVISKTFSDNNNYYKVGVGKWSQSRLIDPITYLAPPFDDLGFKIHLITFYEPSPYKGEFAYQTEAILHTKLVSAGYKRVPHITSNKGSEWFLVAKMKPFLNFIKKEIGSIFPTPLATYAFVKGAENAKKIKLSKKGHSTDLLKLLKDAEAAVSLKKAKFQK
jgi:hypothetical protein